MESKICTKCQIDQLITEYRVNKGYTENVCRTCNRTKAAEARKTRDGLVNRIYDHQVQSSKTRGHDKPCYTKQQLITWVHSQDNFEELYSGWVTSNYSTDSVPSVDRVDDRLGYTLDNIQLMTYKENRDKLHIEIGEEHNNKFIKAVRQYTTDGKFVKEYISVADAGRATKIATASITYMCKGVDTNGKKRLQSDGFTFRYADEVKDGDIEPIGKRGRGAGPKGSTGVKGVIKYGNKYQVIVSHNSKRYYFGAYDTVCEAKEVYEIEAKKLKE